MPFSMAKSVMALSWSEPAAGMLVKLSVSRHQLLTVAAMGSDVRKPPLFSAMFLSAIAAPGAYMEPRLIAM